MFPHFIVLSAPVLVLVPNVTHIIFFRSSSLRLLRLTSLCSIIIRAHQFISRICLVVAYPISVVGTFVLFAPLFYTLLNEARFCVRRRTREDDYIAWNDYYYFVFASFCLPVGGATKK